MTITYDATEPIVGFEYRVTATNAAIPLGTSPCAGSDGGKTIFCDAEDNVYGGVDIVGGSGNDAFTINGASYYSGSPALTIEAGQGNDTFTAGPDGALSGASLQGEDGDDTFVGSDALSDYFVAEAGNDTYKGGSAPVPAGVDPDDFQRYNAPDYWSPDGDAAVNVSLDGQANDTDGQGGTDDVTGIERIAGTPGNDTLAAGGDGVLFFGAGGDDTLTGSPQADQLDGSSGNDTLRGSGGDDDLEDGDFDEASRLSASPARITGNDTLDGGDGDDSLGWGAGKDDLVGGAGTDTAFTTRLATQTFESAVPDDFVPKEQALTISLDDQPNDGPTGGSEGDNVHADVENVTISSSGGMVWPVRAARVASNSPQPAGDTVTGSAAPNVISTGGGNDTIDPGAGPDTVIAGSGDDTINAVDKATDTVQCGQGTDTVGADLPGSNPGRADTLTDCEAVTGTALGLEGGVLPTAPKVTLGGTKKLKVAKFLRTYTVTNTVSSDQAASATGELTLTGAKIAKVGALSIGSGKLKSGMGTRKLKVKVALKYRKALKRKLKKHRRKGTRLALVVTVKNASGQSTVSRRTITIKG